MTAQPKPYITEEDYLQREQSSTEKHEYFAGRVYAMAGASEAHNVIAINIAALLRASVRGSSCRAYPSDMRVKIIPTGLLTYPDFTIVCGQSQFSHQDKRDTLINPTAIIEILSPSTESYDRGEKFQHYRTIETLKEYILVAQNKYHIEHFVRHEPAEWRLSDVIGSDAVLTLHVLPVSIPLKAIYEDVSFIPNAALLREMRIRNSNEEVSPEAGAEEA
jgi:Uma2 family endonuclease